MRTYTNLSSFYRGRDWEQFLKAIKAERTNASGLIECEYCRLPIVKAYDVIGHHIEPLTLSNVNNPAISLNASNVQLVHHRCHNAIHNRFGLYMPQKVYIVHGSPLSGKTSFVKENKTDRDLVVDIDMIWSAVTLDQMYVKNNYLKSNIFAVRDNLLEQIKMRRGTWQNAWVIGAYPMRGERERLADRLSAELIHIDTDKDTCLERLYSTADNRDINAWSSYIDDYFNQYQS